MGIIVNGNCPNQGLPPDPPLTRPPIVGAPVQIISRQVAMLRQLTDIPVCSCYENEAALAKSTRDFISEASGVKPIQIDAATFGWISRIRLFWLSVNGQAIDLANTPLPPNIEVDQAERHRPCRLRYTGSKPIPERPLTEDGFQFMVDPSEVMEGREPTMPQCFP